MSKIFYRQCHLEKGKLNQLSWIPEQYAVLNKVVKLRNESGHWDNGWIVKFVGSTRLDEPPYAEKQIRDHRKATGDSQLRKDS